MAITGIDAVTFGVEDLDAAKRFFADWGLKQVASTANGARFETLDGGTVDVRPIGDPSLPPAMEAGSTLREIVWGTDTDADVAVLADKLKAKPQDGMVRCVDPNGLTIGIRKSRRRPVKIEATSVNAPGAPARVDRASPIYDSATPITIGHLVLFTGDLDAANTFYTERLGFQLSDRYPGDAVFLRCQPRGGHHNLFMLKRPGKPGLNHVAFIVKDIHEVVGGGMAMNRKGWETEMGPGRHPISSAFFWYVKSPCGGSTEYFADEDYLTENWRPRDFERNLANFTEWAVKGGIDGTTRRQKA
jgi:catechol 2,3-dioxygenase-like lactoylglutathione lyase family enzyme